MLCITSPTSPVLAGLWFFVQPINPYRLSPIAPLVKEDDIRQLLVVKLGSKSAKNYSLRLGLKMAPCTTSLSLVFAYAWSNGSWNFVSANAVTWMFINEFLLGLACFVVIGQLLLRWAINDVLRSQAHAA